LEHDPEKWMPVFRKDHAPAKKLDHDPEMAGHRKRPCSAKMLERQSYEAIGALEHDPEKWTPVFG
jgi:hypothetical protein